MRVLGGRDRRARRMGRTARRSVLTIYEMGSSLLTGCLAGFRGVRRGTGKREDHIGLGDRSDQVSIVRHHWQTFSVMTTETLQRFSKRRARADDRK